jgi:hypothetical protein
MNLIKVYYIHVINITKKDLHTTNMLKKFRIQNKIHLSSNSINITKFLHNKEYHSILCINEIVINILIWKFHKTHW